MTRGLLDVLRCPDCQGALTVHDARDADGEIESGTLACEVCAARYPVIRFVPRFVPADNYSSSFGFQWNRFRRTQLDSTTGHPISGRRFFMQSGWRPDEIAGHLTL